MYAFLSIFLISFASVIGIFLFIKKEKNIRAYLSYLISFSAGTLLGDALLHLLPTSFVLLNSPVTVGYRILPGILFPFIIERILFVHRRSKYGACEHGYVQALSTVLSDMIHNFLDGAMIMTSYLVSIPLGLATTIAIAFHEIPQEISDFSILLHGKFSVRSAFFLNISTAATSLLGGIIALYISQTVTTINEFIIPFSCGIFLYTAGNYLLPELIKHTTAKQIALEMALLFTGLGIMVLLRTFS